MIIEYTEDGRITHIIFDPVPEGIVSFIEEKGTPFLNLPPVPLPEEPLFYPNGDPIMETVSVPLKDVDGNVLLDEMGNPIMVEEQQQMIDSPGVEDVSCDIMTDYILNGEITPRPTFDYPKEVSITADGVDEFSIENLPDPCLVRLDGQESTVEGGTLTLTADMPAVYTLELIQWPYIPLTITVTANAPDA